MRFIWGILFFVCMAAASADQVYRWVDKDGHVHYSQLPPASTAAQASKMEIAAPPPDAAGVQKAQDLTTQVQERNLQSQINDQQVKANAQHKAQQQKQCDALRARLQLYLQAGPIFTVDAQGERHYISDEDHVKKEQQLQDEITKGCSGR